MTTIYTNLIKTLAPSYDPRHIEAYMRIKYGTLDHLSKKRFSADVELCKACVDMDLAGSEMLALTYGL